jgi:flagellar hook-length control protein FliK
MDLGTAIPAELLTAAIPLGRGPPEVLRPPGRDPDPNTALAPFDLLLQLLGNSLPGELPGGETLPAEGCCMPPSAELKSESDAFAALAALAGSAAPSVPAQPLPAPLTTAAGSLPAGDSSPVQLADAMRLAFAGGASALDGSSRPLAADLLTAGPSDAGVEPDLSEMASGRAPATAEQNARAGGPADFSALSMPDFAARAAANPVVPEPFALRPRGATESRVGTASATPAERVLSLAADLTRAAETQARADGPLTRAVDGQAPIAAAATPVLKNARLDEFLPLAVDAPTGFDSTAAPTPLHGPGAMPAASAAQPSAQLPAHLGAPVDTNAARWEDALASRIQWLVDHKVGEAQIKLNPPELGALDVKISLLDDKTYVQMTAHTAAARDELSQSLPRLRELMSAGGLDLGGATVSGGRDDRSGYQAATHPVARMLPLAAEAVDVAPGLLHGRLTPASRIDIFA